MKVVQVYNCSTMGSAKDLTKQIKNIIDHQSWCICTHFTVAIFWIICRWCCRLSPTSVRYRSSKKMNEYYLITGHVHIWSKCHPINGKIAQRYLIMEYITAPGRCGTRWNFVFMNWLILAKWCILFSNYHNHFNFHM